MEHSAFSRTMPQLSISSPLSSQTSSAFFGALSPQAILWSYLAVVIAVWVIKCSFLPALYCGKASSTSRGARSGKSLPDASGLPCIL